MINLDTGGYKIGCSDIPSERAKYLRYANGLRLDVVWSLPCTDAVTAERALHLRFAAYHDMNEFFWLTDEIVEWIKTRTEAEICAGYDPARYSRPDSWKW